MSERKLTIRIKQAADSSIRDQTLQYQLFASVEIGDRWKSSVTRTISSLRFLPSRGTPFHAENEELQQLRWIRVEGFPKHLIFYRFRPETLIVEIVDVVHAARDLEEVLGISVRN